MKAPELPTKIYFTILDMGSGYAYTPSLDDNGGTEYIRKDALLEWISISKNSLLMDTKAPHLGKVGSLATLDALTDMLNKM